MGEEHRYRLGGEDRKDPCGFIRPQISQTGTEWVVLCGACMLLLPVCAGAPPTE